MEARDLAEVPHPVRMIFGSEDTTGTPELWQRYVGQLPHGELSIVPGAGHQPWWDNAAGVGALVRDFLSD